MNADKPPHSMPLCPLCKQAERVEAYRPFCSKKCADIDLHHWLSGAYTIPATEPPDEWELEMAEQEEQGEDETQNSDPIYLPTDEKPELH
ncbi:MAG: DNA gyrase inhibitor YacG [Alphaproteobacteria bacterium]|nr:DNA gyrase inhibitor YacG [Alphaproteobacteria bacterium]